MRWLGKLLNLILPEDKKLEKLLNFPPEKLRQVLPKAEGSSDNLVFPLFDYRNKNVSALIWAIKYRGHPGALRTVAQILYEEIIEIASDRLLFEGKDKISLIPIPISDKSRRERGWNQTEELSRKIEKMSGGEIKVWNILEKCKETGHQTRLTREERLQNMQNSMRAKPVTVPKGALLILIDDVYTTGATVAEARRALAQIGAKSVLAMTIAH
jgi:ComF family protein